MPVFCMCIYEIYAAYVHFPTDNKSSLLSLKRFVLCAFEATIANQPSSFRLFTLFESRIYWNFEIRFFLNLELKFCL